MTIISHACICISNPFPFQELKKYAQKVTEHQKDGQQWPRGGGGMAHTPWHAYSFSKAVLNAATRVMHQQVKAAGFQHEEVRVLAICPGDVATGT